MRRIVIKYRLIILSVFLLTGMLIAVWPFAFHLDRKAGGVEFQRELNDDNQEANTLPSALDRTNIMLVLLCAGLVGFFGVRRHSKTLGNFVKFKTAAVHSPRRYHE